MRRLLGPYAHPEIAVGVGTVACFRMRTLVDGNAQGR